MTEIYAEHLVAVPAQGAVTVFLNDDGNLVIREAGDFQEEDQIVIVNAASVPTFLRAVRAVLKGGAK